MDDQELLDAIDYFDKAARSSDREFATPILDADYKLVLVHPEPAEVSRERWIEMLPDYIVHEWVVEQRRIDHDGDVAAVLETVRMRATVLGQDRSGLFIIGDVWRRRPDGWKIWRRQSTPLTAGPMPE